MQYLYLFHSLEQNPTSCQDGWYSPEIKHHLRILRKKFRSHPSETTYQKLLTGEQCPETLMCSKLRLTSNQKKDTVSRVNWFWQQKFHEFGCMTLGQTISCQNHHHIHEKSELVHKCNLHFGARKEYISSIRFFSQKILPSFSIRLFSL